jgi:LmbE family N-acetylglucosaminyl deacetylase
MKTRVKVETRHVSSLWLKDKSKALCLVAHPDDEVIWMGGTIMRNPNLDWTVFSLCRGSDADREPKFRRVAAELNVKGIIEDFNDEDTLSLEESIPGIKELILKIVNGQEFDYFFTHGENGEYGHIRHIGTHMAVKELINEGKINAKEIFFFNYKKINRKILPVVPADDSDYILELKPKEYEKKRKIVAEMYGYPYDGIDVNLCSNVEAFKQLRIKN